MQRRAAGYTQEQLARLMDVDRTTVHRWEKGTATPQPWQMPKLARLLKVSATQLRSLLPGSSDTVDELAVTPREDDGRTEVVHRHSQGEQTTAPVASPLAQADGLVADWLSVSSLIEGTATSLPVTEADIGAAEGILDLFRQLDHTHGARQYQRQVSSYIDNELEALLRRQAADESVARRRARLTAGFCELAGYQAVDTGSPDQAQAYYRRALTLTAVTNDQAYSAYLVAVNLGHLALHCGEPETALRWAASAQAAAGTAASPATRAAITAVVARANARMRRETEATKLIIQAEKLLDTADHQDEPTWIRYFNHAYLADEVAHCLHDLGRAPAARSQLAEALSGVGEDRVRRRAIDAALLAATWLRTGHLDRACAAGRDAVAYAARTGSGRCIERVAGVLADLRAHDDYAPARELREFARVVLPEADGMAVTLSGGS
ncbi:MULTISPECIES: helix-turn-helix transcriptional regulator [Streptomycetaceae]|uniref:helix-turn-helix transcriptional regulator n=1 Tax=Streptomycetaceae TaxID=2062 RepID=UPI00130128CB|nr:helix-turn-helix transcriptional regulator [Streptomyces sp. CB02056]